MFNTPSNPPDVNFSASVSKAEAATSKEACIAAPEVRVICKNCKMAKEDKGSVCVCTLHVIE